MGVFLALPGLRWPLGHSKTGNGPVFKLLSRASVDKKEGT
jgi:hypothetical protein